MTARETWAQGRAHDREAAWRVLQEYTRFNFVRSHGLSVEAAMRRLAGYYGEDEELWGVVGLIHDFDYDNHPDPVEHGLHGGRILRELGWPELIVRAVGGHNEPAEVPRGNRLEYALLSCDQLTAVIFMVASGEKVAPATVDPESVREAMRENSGAMRERRAAIEEGWRKLGFDPDEHIALVAGALGTIDRAGAAAAAGYR